MNEQAAIGSKGWNKADALMTKLDTSGWAMSLKAHRTFVTLTLTKGDAAVEINWKDDGGLMATRRLRTAKRDIRSFTIAYALRFIAAN